MFQLALYQPEIPPNTGNIIRLCANTGTPLHLIKPLGFDMDDKRLRRAGLDYSEWASVQVHDSWSAFKASLNGSGTIYAATTKATRVHSDVNYTAQDIFLFGPETRGLPAEILAELGEQQCIRIPMLAHSRSLNLSNSAAVILFEAWRQQGFAGAKLNTSA
jgi:tRNA (cytidine/uridine-2'-O-)-methyltransferase